VPKPLFILQYIEIPPYTSSKPRLRIMIMSLNGLPQLMLQGAHLAWTQHARTCHKLETASGNNISMDTLMDE
jgi:hypothetical protein